MRQSISREAGFSKKEREAHCCRVARLAKQLAKQRHVVVSVIAPHESTRCKVDEIASPFWIFLKRRSEFNTKEYPYEVPCDPDLVLDGEAEEVFEKLVKRWNDGLG